MRRDDHPRLSQNNFDLIRLLLAATVCLTHAYQLSGFESLSGVARLLSSTVAVKGFFVVSGFLIFMSYERSSSLRAYAVKRIRRIYPAYFTVVMLCAFGLAAVSRQRLGDYFSSDWVAYVLANLSFLNFLHQTLPGVFESHPLAAVNGALWTLKIEVSFYLSVPLFVAVFRRSNRLLVLLLVYGGSVAYAELFALAAERTGSGLYAELGRQLPGQLCYFMAGAFLYYYLPLFERRLVPFLVVAVAILLATRLCPLPLLEPFALATLVVFFGLFLYVGNLGKYGDFSYGVYILHFPIIQLLLLGSWPQAHPWVYFAVVILLTGLGAMALWHLVEKRFLLRGSHYVAAVRAVAAPAASAGVVGDSALRRQDGSL